MSQIDIIKPALDALKSSTGMVLLFGLAVVFLLVSGIGLLRVFQDWSKKPKSDSTANLEEKR